MSKKTYASYAGALPKPVYPHAHLPFLTELDVPSTLLLQTLHRALRSRRRHGTQAEARFVAWLVNRLPVTMIDGAGNIHVDLRTQPHHRTMFTSHTDTVHDGGGTNKIRLDATDPKRVLWRADEGDCLGADDGAGVALMVHMIDAGVPGLYVFFRGEEVGGIGSSWMDKHFSAVLKDIDRCVSLDRADQNDVITHQGMGRCCSDAFADALAAALTTDDFALAYMPDNTGVFTDSANLTDHIPECTNLSVGYKHQHGDGEYQDVTFLTRLADQLCVVAWDDLPTERDPKAVDIDAYTYSFGYGTKGTNAPTGGVADPDADAKYLSDAINDAAWGYKSTLRSALASYWGEHPDTFNIDALSPQDMLQVCHKLDNGQVCAEEVYGDLFDIMYEGA